MTFAEYGHLRKEQGMALEIESWENRGFEDTPAHLRMAREFLGKEGVLEKLHRPRK